MPRDRDAPLEAGAPRVVCTVGIVNVEPKIVTAVPGRLRDLARSARARRDVLAAMLRDARDAADRARATTTSRSSGAAVADRAAPVRSALIGSVRGAVREETGDAPRLPSGPLHDAAEMVPHMPVVMMFAYSSNGLSHCKEKTPRTVPAADDRSLLRLVDTVANDSKTEDRYR
jgi:N-carbamoyl-L-amino-acid hydrolase